MGGGAVEVDVVAFVSETVAGDEGGVFHVRGELLVGMVDEVFVVGPWAGGKLAELAGDEGEVGGGEGGAEAFDQIDEGIGVEGGEFGFGIGLALMPEDAAQGAGFHSDLGAADGVVPRVPLGGLVVGAWEPRGDG